MKRWRIQSFLLAAVLMLNAAGAIADQVVATSDEEQESRQTLSQSIPFKQEEPVSEPFLGKLLLAMVMLLGAAAGVLFVARRYMGPITGRGVGATRVIELLEIRRLTPKLTMFLVRVRGREVLLAQHGDSLVVIGEGWERPVRSDHLIEKE